jgi:predicted nucleic acid-binding Zn ribbon protein
MAEMELKHCLACDKPLHGRSDKKFCNDYCRNVYNNTLKSANTNAIKDINNMLVKNRKVLEGILGEKDMEKTTKEKLLQSGLNFKYITHTYTNKKGNTYCFCYEYGYLPLENDWYLVVKRNKENAG